MSYIEIAVGHLELGAVGWWAFGIGGCGVAQGRMVGFASCKHADTLVFFV